MKKLLFSGNFPTKMVSGLLLLAVCGGCRFVDPYWRVHPESVVDGSSVFPTNEWGGYYPTQWRKWSDEAPKSKSPEPVVIPLSTQKPLPPPLLIKPRPEPEPSAVDAQGVGTSGQTAAQANPLTTQTPSTTDSSRPGAMSNPEPAPTNTAVPPVETTPASQAATSDAPLTTNKNPIVFSPTTTPGTVSSSTQEPQKTTTGVQRDPKASVEVIEDWRNDPNASSTDSHAGTATENGSAGETQGDPNDPTAMSSDLSEILKKQTLQEIENERIIRERESQSQAAPLPPSETTPQTVEPGEEPADLPEVEITPTAPTTGAEPELPVLADPTVSDIRQPAEQFSMAPAMDSRSEQTVWVPLESPNMEDTSILSVQFSQRIENNNTNDELPTMNEAVLTPKTAAMNVLVGPMRPITGPIPQNWDRASWNPYAEVCNSQMFEDCR